MKTTKTKLLALVASAALVAMLGLAACGGSSSTSAASSAASGSASASSAEASTSASSAAASESASSAAASASASADESVSLEALAKELFQNCLVGQDDKNNVIYFYAQGEDGKTAALLVYDIANDAFSVHAGAYEEPTADTVKIDTKGAGEAIEFKVTPNADKTAVDFAFENGSTVTMGSVVDEETEQMLKELDQLIAQVNSSTEAQ